MEKFPCHGAFFLPHLGVWFCYGTFYQPLTYIKPTL